MAPRNALILGRTYTGRTTFLKKNFVDPAITAGTKVIIFHADVRCDWDDVKYNVVEKHKYSEENLLEYVKSLLRESDLKSNPGPLPLPEGSLSSHSELLVLDDCRLRYERDEMFDVLKRLRHHNISSVVVQDSPSRERIKDLREGDRHNLFSNIFLMDPDVPPAFEPLLLYGRDS